MSYKGHGKGASTNWQRLAQTDPQAIKDKRIIAFLKESQQQYSDVRREGLRGLENKQLKEEQNIDILDKARRELDNNKDDATKRRRQNEIDRQKAIADEARREADYFQDLTPTAARNLGNIAKSATQAGIWLRDEKVYQEMLEDAADKREKNANSEDPFVLQAKASNSITKEGQDNEYKEYVKGNWNGGEEYRRPYEISTTKKFWGYDHAKLATSNLRQEFDSIMNNAKEGSEHVEFQRWLAGKGVKLNTAAGREARTTFDNLLGIRINKNNQQALVAESTARTDKTRIQINAAIKRGDKAAAHLHFRQAILNKITAHEMEGQTYSSPDSRGRLNKFNLGHIVDGEIEWVLDNLEFTSYEQFEEFILDAESFADAKGIINTFGKHREQNSEEFSKKFLINKDKGIKNARLQEETRILIRVEDLKARIKAGDEFRKASETNKAAEPSREDYIDIRSKEGKDKLFSLYQSAESESERNQIGLLLYLDPKNTVSAKLHTEYVESVHRGDGVRSAAIWNTFSEAEKKFYKEHLRVASLNRMIDADIKYKDLLKENVDRIAQLTGAQFTTGKTWVTVTKAAEALTQIQYAANDGFDGEDPRYQGQSLKKELEKVANDELKNNPLFDMADVKTSASTSTKVKEMIHFAGLGVLKNQTEISSAKDIDTLLSFSMVEGEGITREMIAELDLISRQGAADIIRGAIYGDKNIRLPKILWEFAKENPHLSIVDIANDQFKKNGLLGEFGIDELTEEDLSPVKASQIEFYKIKTGLVDLYSDARNNYQACAWADVNKCTMELHGKPFVKSELYEYLKNKERRQTVAKLPTDYKQTEQEAFTAARHATKVANLPTDYKQTEKEAFEAAHKDGDLESLYHFIYEKPFTNTIGGI